MPNLQNHSKLENKHDTQQALDVHMIQTWIPSKKRNTEVLENMILTYKDTFPWTEFHHSKDPVVITRIIASHKISRIYIDWGNLVNIMYDHCFKQLLDDIRKQIRPSTIPLTGFSFERSTPDGAIHLKTIVGSHLLS